ncbi:hypothetical protein [Brevibacillus centrosporus]|uniref:hypothetical protein n=1 Tax=Brevibacillus centrosporus TaxID=54910 RepID=UPI003B028377
MDSITKLMVFLLDNIFSVVIVTFALVVLWASVGTDVRVPNKDIGGLGKIVKNEMETLVPKK